MAAKSNARLFGAGVAREDRAGQREAMDLRRPVVDAKGADVAIGALDYGVVGDAHPAENLQRTIDDAPSRLRAEDLAHAGFIARLLALIEHPRRVPDREAAERQLVFIIGEHEADPLMLADRAAEGVTAPRIVGRDRMTAPRRTQPAHAVRQPRRTQSHLRVAEALADRAEDALGPDPHVVEFDLGVAAR